MSAILMVIYICVGYWAVNVVFYENKIVVYSSAGQLFVKKFGIALFFGWILIPIAILKKSFQK